MCHALNCRTPYQGRRTDKHNWRWADKGWLTLLADVRFLPSNPFAVAESIEHGT
jgi:hypothetical protein